jgi:phospholipase C
VQQYLNEGSPMPDEVMGYYDRSTLPISYALADNYALCERWFASVMGPTWPNRYHVHLATSNGMKTNDAVTGLPSIFDRLDDKGVSNIYYSSNLPFTLTYGKTEGVQMVADFFTACAAGTLPSFCMVEPTLTFGATIGNDDHPPADITMGQAFLSTIVAALSASPLWNKCLLIVTYDEHGGFFDHVAPPTTYDDIPEFEQLGFRVPGILVGPFVRRGCAISTQFDHVSIVSTVTKRFGLEPLNMRVTMTNDLSTCIDPNFLDDPQPPATIPTMIVDRPQVHREGANVPGHEELFALADTMNLPDTIDRRAYAQEAVDAVLDEGERLGVLVVRR